MLVGAIKVLVGAFSMIVKSSRTFVSSRFEALNATRHSSLEFQAVTAEHYQNVKARQRIVRSGAPVTDIAKTQCVLNKTAVAGKQDSLD